MNIAGFGSLVACYPGHPSSVQAAVSLDNFGGMRGVARCTARELARVGKTKPVKAGARTVKVLGYIRLQNVKGWQLPVIRTKIVTVGELP